MLTPKVLDMSIMSVVVPETKNTEQEKVSRQEIRK